MRSITCAVDQRRHGTLLRKHALHPTGFFWVVKSEEVGFTQTQRITWRQKEQRIQPNKPNRNPQGTRLFGLGVLAELRQRTLEPSILIEVHNIKQDIGVTTSALQEPQLSKHLTRASQSLTTHRHDTISPKSRPEIGAHAGGTFPSITNPFSAWCAAFPASESLSVFYEFL